MIIQRDTVTHTFLCTNKTGIDIFVAETMPTVA